MNDFVDFLSSPEFKSYLCPAEYEETNETMAREYKVFKKYYSYKQQDLYHLLNDDDFLINCYQILDIVDNKLRYKKEASKRIYNLILDIITKHLCFQPNDSQEILFSTILQIALLEARENNALQSFLLVTPKQFRAAIKKEMLKFGGWNFKESLLNYNTNKVPQGERLKLYSVKLVDYVQNRLRTYNPNDAHHIYKPRIISVASSLRNPRGMHSPKKRVLERTSSGVEVVTAKAGKKRISKVNTPASSSKKRATSTPISDEYERAIARTQNSASSDESGEESHTTPFRKSNKAADSSNSVKANRLRMDDSENEEQKNHPATPSFSEADDWGNSVIKTRRAGKRLSEVAKNIIDIGKRSEGTADDDLLEKKKPTINLRK